MNKKSKVEYSRVEKEEIKQKLMNMEKREGVEKEEKVEENVKGE